MTRTERIGQYAEILQAADAHGGIQAVDLACRELCKTDLFYLLAYALNRKDVRDSDWLFDRCREVQANPDGYLDLWAREHYKSTIVTFAKTIQDILVNPEITIGIFSHTKPIARAFLRQIKYELETNTFLQRLFPEVLYIDPKKEAPAVGNAWSEDKGITVKRSSNPKEATIEAHGLVDGQPTSKHYSLLIYDDVVTLESVSSPEMIQKTTDALALSYNLGAHGGRRRFIGTRYHFSDTYREIMKRGTATPRLYPATDDGTIAGQPVFLSQKTNAEKRRDMGPYVYGCLSADTQILMADWSLQPIHAVQEGDMVVGWTMEPGKRSKLIATRVIATQHHRSDTVDVVMSGGQKITCTHDHKWWTGRRVEDRGREVYRPISLNNDKKGVSSLCKVLDLTDNRWPSGPDVAESAAYLAGIFDGEGTVSAGTIHISQCERTHPEVCNRIRHTLTVLGFEWYECRPKGREHQVDFTISGGRQEKFRFLALCDPAKRNQVSRSMFGARRFSKSTREAVASVAPGERRMVYNIQTDTGNYIANGYCSKNCQMLQNPTSESQQSFDLSWLRYYSVEPDLHDLNIYIVVDPAHSKKKSSDYTVILVIGLGADRNYYLIDGIRKRLSLSERTDELFRLHREYIPQSVGYEQYGIQADVEHIQEAMERKNYRFSITPLGGRVSKEERIKRLQPKFEQGRIWLPKFLWQTNQDGKRENIIATFIDEEYQPFPVCVHDDILDDMANILHPDMPAHFPTVARRPVKESWRDKILRSAHRGASAQAA